jgi:hypothetical protein
MGEQNIPTDPRTGKPLPAPASADSRQNDGYIPDVAAHLTQRDFSRPHTIPPEEFEAATGRNHTEAVSEYIENHSDTLPAEYMPATRQARPDKYVRNRDFGQGQF